MVVDIFRVCDRMADFEIPSGLQAVIVRVMGREKRKRGLIVDEAEKVGVMDCYLDAEGLGEMWGRFVTTEVLTSFLVTTFMLLFKILGTFPMSELKYICTTWDCSIPLDNIVC